MTEYVVYHKSCGHVAGISNARQIAEKQIEILAALGRWGWRIRVAASDDDIRALLREDRCESCAA